MAMESAVRACEPAFMHISSVFDDTLIVLEQDFTLNSRGDMRARAACPDPAAAGVRLQWLAAWPLISRV